MKVYKRIPNWKVTGFASILLCALLFSCSNEDFLENVNQEKASARIFFGVSSDRNAETRGYVSGGNDKGDTLDRFVLRSEDSEDTLCVRTIVSEGIESSGIIGDVEAVTRGTPVNGDNFYDKFHVVAYWKKNGIPVVNQFFMDEDATKKTGDIWSTKNIYYWPGAEHSFEFYAWAPTDVGMTTPGSPGSRELKYTVPKEAKDQKDIVVAKTGEIAGDNKNEAVALAFKHICTAVRFVVVNQMQSGEIKSVSLKSVKKSGTYNMANGAWSLDDATGDFSQELNRKTTLNETAGNEITSAEGTFMMLPQTLPEDAKVEVVFINANNKERKLSASIGGTEWGMGKTVTYKLSITPEYELKFVSEPKAQDAHYVIYPITIKSDNKLPVGGWTLTSNNTDNVTFVENGKFSNNDIQALVDKGYWLDEYKGTSTLKSSTKGEVKVYVFLKENATEKDRDIELYLKPTAGNYESTVFSFKQYCPAWNDGIGVERIQDADYPWGFNWGNAEIVYKMPWGLGIYKAIIDNIINNRSYSYLKSRGEPFLNSWTITVDLSEVPKLNDIAKDDSNGEKNTWELYHFSGINELEPIKQQVERWGGVLVSNTFPDNSIEFAAKSCAMKNKYSKLNKETNKGQTIYIPVLDEADMVWFLPAAEEAKIMNDQLYPLSGDYWTSTAIPDPGNTAYKYTAGGVTSPQDRNTNFHVRAVRKKPGNQ